MPDSCENEHILGLLQKVLHLIPVLCDSAIVRVLRKFAQVCSEDESSTEMKTL